MKTIKIFILISLFFGFTSVFSQQTEDPTKEDSKAIKEKVDTEQWRKDRPPPNFNPEKKNKEAAKESQVVDLKNRENLDKEELREDRPPPNWVPPVKKETSKSTTSKDKSQSPRIDESTGKEILNPKPHGENNKDPNNL